MLHSLILLLAILLWAPLASAQEPTPPETEAVRQARETARPLARKGFEAYEAEDYDEALRYFREAEAIFHAPFHNLYIARSLRAQGRKLEAHTTYRQLVEEKLASYAPVAFLEAQAEAKKEMKTLEAELGAIDVETAPEAEIAVDGRTADASETVFVLPGEHEVTGRVPWVDAPQSRSLTLAAGARETVTFGFPPEPAPAGSADRPYFVPALVTMAVGGAALIAGTVTGIIHLEEVNDIRSRCVDDSCPPAEREPAEATTTVGHVSTAMFVIGGLATAAGATLLVLDLTEDDAPPLDAHLGVSAGGVSLWGRF